MASENPRFIRSLDTYRPIIDRAIFAVAVLGILTSVHLGIQQDRGFDQGCFGFSAAQQVEDTFDCAAVTESEASRLFGISNSTWGLLFYVVVAALTAFAAFDLRGKLAQFKMARAIVVLLGFIYTLYLVYYQFFGISELCALCLTSAGLTTILFVLQAIDFGRRRHSAAHRASGSAKPAPRRELVYMSALAVLVLVLIGADFAYYAGLDSSQDAPVVADEQTQPSREVQGSATAPQQGSRAVPGECMFDPQKEPVEDFAGLINFFDPEKGNPAADVTVVEYFDPNCPHCKTLHPVVERVAETHGDRARFVFKPFVLWERSFMQSEALHAAAQEGKFFEMLDLQYAIQQPQTGLSEEQLRAIAEQIGMDPDEMMDRISRGTYRRPLLEDKQKGAQAGITGTPAVIINGRFVSGRSRTAECLRQLIDEVARG